MTGYAWLFLCAWVLTAVVATGYWYENTYLRDALDQMIEAFRLAMDDDDEISAE